MPDPFVSELRSRRARLRVQLEQLLCIGDDRAWLALDTDEQDERLDLADLLVAELDRIGAELQDQLDRPRRMTEVV